MKVKLLTFAITFLDRLAEKPFIAQDWHYSYRIWAFTDRLWAIREKALPIQDRARVKELV